MSFETAKFVKRHSDSNRSQAAIENACKRLVINLMVNKPDLRSLLVTSASPGGGATTVTSFLARYMANSLKRVVVIDANFDQPVLQAVFTPKTASAAAAPGQQRVPLVAQPTDNPRVDLVTATNLATTTSRVFDSPEFKADMARLSKEYDVVLIDSASATVSPDTLALGARVDGVLLVIQAEKTRQQVALKAIDDLRAVGANIVGSVLNRRVRVIPESIYRYL